MTETNAFNVMNLQLDNMLNMCEMQVGASSDFHINVVCCCICRENHDKLIVNIVNLYNLLTIAKITNQSMLNLNLLGN